MVEHWFVAPATVVRFYYTVPCSVRLSIRILGSQPIEMGLIPIRSSSFGEPPTGARIRQNDLGRSSNGRIGAFEAFDLGSNPSLPAKFRVSSANN